MENLATNEKPNEKSFAIASLVCGILSIIMSFLWFAGAILGLTAVVLGALSLKRQRHGKAIAGIVLGSIGTLLSIVVIIVMNAAIPALQRSSRDTARRNDVSIISTEIVNATTENRGKLPEASQISTSTLTQVNSISSSGSPTTSTVVYITGKACDGSESTRAYSVSIKLENNTDFCTGS